VDRFCPSCDRVLTAVDHEDEHASARGRFLCQECQILYIVTATNELREVEE
jgi:hypothetical protein